MGLHLNNDVLWPEEQKSKRLTAALLDVCKVDILGEQHIENHTVYFYSENSHTTKIKYYICKAYLMLEN